MPNSPDLAVPLLDAAQSNKYATVNEAIDMLDVALAGTATIDCTAGGSVATTALSADGLAYWRHGRALLNGTPAAGFNLIVPLTSPKVYIVDNQSGHTATVKGASGSGIAVATGNVQILYCDGTNVIAINTPSSGGAGTVTMGGDITGASNASLISKFNGIAWSAGTAAPGAGAHVVGEIVWNTTPAADGVIGFVCVSAGTPGTWKGFGLIEH